MRWRLACSRLLLVSGLLLVVASGCANHSRIAVRQAVTQPEPLIVQAETQVSSRSDRLRGNLDYVHASAPEPATAQERPEPQPPEITPLRGTGEADPRDVIDWLLKQRR